ncbi:TetR/AcrR family transcriptional regulator [Kitasatospora sp. NPDC006697]|uniref:TetR/AcrR family transcriptional regulator n=1 Tax=Kitasatospora sp. NPDC006697 TaxID=3364020 RepID=UPI003693A912
MPVRDPGRSVTATARRAQIMAATVETIAELGYAQASFARIAERAGLSSTRLISYHFAGKGELIQAVVADVRANMARHLRDRLANCADARSTLAEYIRAVVAFSGSHRPQMQALLSVFPEHRGASREARTGPETVGRILRAGQRSGEFRTFDTQVMAATVQRALDGLPFLLRTDPELDLDHYAEELVSLFDFATRRAR